MLEFIQPLPEVERNIPFAIPYVMTEPICIKTLACVEAVGVAEKHDAVVFPMPRHIIVSVCVFVTVLPINPDVLTTDPVQPVGTEATKVPRI